MPETIILYQAPTRPWKTPNLSPFCAKLECYLRMSEVPHTVAPMSRGQAPRKKIPYIQRADKTLLADSQHIIEELEKARGGAALDHGMTPIEHAQGRMIRRTLEEATYFTGMYLRWVADTGYPHVRDELKKLVPGFVLPLIRRDIRKRLVGQGTGLHTCEEIEAMASADFAALATILGDKPFLFGDAPRTVDCVAFAFLEGVLGFPADGAVKTAVASHENLVAFRARIRDRWWKDLA